MNPDNEIDSPYCLICGSCGEEGCCSPLNCLQENEQYCETNLQYLKFGYTIYKGLSDFMEKNKGKFPELEKEYDRLFDEAYDKYQP